jgi:hypothetical protein
MSELLSQAFESGPVVFVEARLIEIADSFQSDDCIFKRHLRSR